MPDPQLRTTALRRRYMFRRNIINLFDHMVRLTPKRESQKAHAFRTLVDKSVVVLAYNNTRVYTYLPWRYIVILPIYTTTTIRPRHGDFKTAGHSHIVL